MRQGIMALEGMDDIPVDREEANLDFVEAPENDIAEADDAAGEVAAVDADVTEATDTAETLDNMATELEGSVEEGGMGEREAAAVEVAVEHLCKKLGFHESKRKLGPALESFGKASTPEQRIKATKLAVESLREKAKAIWARIIEAIKKGLEYVQKFFKSLFDGAVKLEKRAEAVAKAASSAKGEHPADHKVKVPGTLSVGGSIPDGVGIASAFKKHMEMPLIKQDRAGMLKLAADKVAGFAKSDGANAQRVMGELLGAFKVGSPSSNRNIGVKNGDTLLEEHLVFGGQSFYMQLEGDFKAKSFIDASTGSKSVEGGEAAPVTIEQAASLATAVAQHMKSTYTGMETSAREAKAAAAELISKVSAAAKEEGANAQLISTATHTAVQLACVAGVALKKYDVSVSNAVLNFAAACVPKGKVAEKTGETAPA